jgi:hydroxyacylglutathione hydrolase
VTYAIDRAGAPTEGSVSLENRGSASGQPALLSGDVLFQGSVGRVDLPGGDWATLECSIGMLMSRFERDAVVYPGHMGVTTLGREWDSNPFLTELRAAAMSPVPARTTAQEQR